MVFPLALLLLATQLSGQQVGWPGQAAATAGPGQWQSPYAQPPMVTTYGQPGGYPQPLPQQSPAAWATNHQFGQHQFVQQPGLQPGQLHGQQLGQPQASYQPNGQPQPISYQPPVEPPPSRQVIEEEMDTFLRESEANLEAGIQQLEDEFETTKTTFLAEQEQRKLEYLASMEKKEQQYLQDLQQHLASRKQEARTAAQDYAARVKKQATELTMQSALYGHHSEHKTKVELLNDEGRRNKEELEEQIRAAYDAVRHGQSSVDPRAAVQEARQRFDQQMQALALKRNALDLELHQNFASMHGTN